MKYRPLPLSVRQSNWGGGGGGGARVPSVVCTEQPWQEIFSICFR